ncbi:MAG: lysophospholipid acyltransferase family protein [Dokdonella sp.]
MPCQATFARCTSCVRIGTICSAASAPRFGKGSVMLRAIDRGWRVFATGLAFATFGLGGVVLGGIGVPLLHLLVRDRGRRRTLARKAIHSGFRTFVGWMRLLGVLRYEVIDQWRLQRRGLLVLANHPTLIDVVFLISLIPNADCVVRSGLFRNVFTGAMARSADYLCNDSGPGLVENCIESLRAGNNLVMFPEGTRTRPGEPMTLQRGAANVAVRGARNITPVRIRCEPLTLTKGLAWWRVPPRRAHFTIRVEEDIAIAPFLIEGEEARSARELTRLLHDYFETT